MDLVWIPLSVFGQFIGHQIFSHLLRNRILPARIGEKILIFLPPIMVLVFWSLRNHLVASIVLTLLTPLLSVVLMNVNRRRRQRRFERDLLPLLDDLIGKMKCGMSLRESLGIVCSHRDYAQTADLRELPSLLEFPDRIERTQLIPAALNLLTELEKIEKSRAKTIEKVRSYREKIRTAEKFRRKSRQAADQVRAQVVVCSLLYFGLLFFVGVQNLNLLFSGPIYLSLALFCCGLLLMRWIEGSFQWKI